MPRVTQSHLDARKRQILEAAFRVFSRRGFHEATMHEVAQEAGLSAGTLYRYFEGKEALVEALAAWGREQKRPAIEGLAAGDLSALGETIGAIATLLEGREAADGARLDVRLWGEALGEPGLRRTVRAELAAIRDAVADHVRSRQEEGTMRRDVDPEAAGRVATSLLVGLALQKAFDPGLDVQGYAALVARLLDDLGQGT